MTELPIGVVVKPEMPYVKNLYHSCQLHTEVLVRYSSIQVLDIPYDLGRQQFEFPASRMPIQALFFSLEESEE
jgi:hypothetical protein